MRHPSTVVLLLLSLCPASLWALASHGAPAAAAGLRDLAPLQLEDQWTTALVNRDTRTFDRLLAPNFVYTENASVMNRRDVINSVSGPDKVEWARNEGMKVHDFGDVQVITGVLHLRGKGKDGAFDRRYQFTDTWQRRNGRWQIIAAQDYLIPK
jgi:ketosteroid isomerase-like protein